MASNWQAFKLYSKLAFLSGCGYYVYLKQKCSKIKRDHTDFEAIQLKKDNTRPSNTFYGINWGYRSDEAMEKTLDSGDLLFFNYDCSNCFSPKETFLCYAH
jgi:hypothetical protein